MAALKNIQTAVKSAVEHLHELSTRMTSGDVSNTFKEDDVSKIDKLIAAILNLETERQRMRERYETETIRGNKLRYDLVYFPDDAEKEAEAAVKSARETNADDIKRLREYLAITKKEIISLEKTLKDLQDENEKLGPEREKVHKEHDAVINNLNTSLALKSKMKIKLNETRDKIKEKNEMIMSLEDEIIQMKDDLIDERTKCKERKKLLQAEMDECKSKIHAQGDKNAILWREIDDLEIKEKEFQTNISRIKKEEKEITDSYTSQCRSKEQLSQQLDSVIAETHSIKNKKEKMVEEEQTEDQGYVKTKKNLLTRLKQVESDTLKAKEKETRLDLHTQKLDIDLSQRRKKHMAIAEKLEARRATIVNLKTDLAKKTKEVKKVQLDQEQEEDSLQEKKNEHLSTIASLNERIEDLRGILNMERNKRKDLQTMRDQLNQTLDDYKRQSRKHLDDFNLKIQRAKYEQVELMKQGEQLQKLLFLDDTKISDLRGELHEAEAEDMEVKKEVEKKISVMKANVEEVRQSVSVHQNLVEGKLPDFQAFEAVYKEVKDVYTKLTESIEDKKKRNVNLLNEIEKSKMLKTHLHDSTDALRKVLEDKRAASIERMKQCMEETTHLETTICNVGGQIKKVIEENFKFQEANNKIMSEIDECNVEADDNTNKISSMVDEYKTLQRLLWEGWQSDKDLQEETEERDDAFVDSLGELMEKTGGRAEQVDDITRKLEDEIRMLTVFLEKVTTHRPIDIFLEGTEEQSTTPSIDQT